MSRRLFAVAVAVVFVAGGSSASAPAAGDQPEWRQSVHHEVLLDAYDYEPRTILLEAGRPARLRFVNGGRSTMAFSAKRFFREAEVRSGDADLIQDGTLRLRPGERRIVVLVPAPGRYHVRSTNLLHRLLGMTGKIVVE